MLPHKEVWIKGGGFRVTFCCCNCDVDLRYNKGNSQLLGVGTVRIFFPQQHQMSPKFTGRGGKTLKKKITAKQLAIGVWRAQVGGEVRGCFLARCHIPK